jgi:hypothetical protein
MVPEGQNRAPPIPESLVTFSSSSRTLGSSLKTSSPEEQTT